MNGAVGGFSFFKKSEVELQCCHFCFVVFSAIRNFHVENFIVSCFTSVFGIFLLSACCGCPYPCPLCQGQRSVRDRRKLDRHIAKNGISVPYVASPASAAAASDADGDNTSAAEPDSLTEFSRH